MNRVEYGIGIHLAWLGPKALCHADLCLHWQLLREDGFQSAALHQSAIPR